MTPEQKKVARSAYMREWRKRSMSQRLFYIQHKGFVGNCLLWWCPGGSGYTCDIDKAMKVSEKQAKESCESRPKEDFPRPADEVRVRSQRHVIGPWERGQ